MKIVSINRAAVNHVDITQFDESHAREVLKFHSTFPQYAPTPLHSLKNLARSIGIKNLLIKDESYRFGLNAFKVLGSSYAVARILSARLQSRLQSFAELIAGRLEPHSMTFATTTDGNHGRGLAWTANQLRQNSVVYMPRGTKSERLENIRRENSDASIVDMNYDDAVRFMRRQSEANGWILVQDTTLPGYVGVPRLIMQGYLTMALETYRQLPEKPTHIFLQAGVGSMAGAVSAFFANVYGESRPRVIVVEPNDADCIYQTALANDGALHSTKGALNTMMAGLACGEPCSIAWELLSATADFALTCGDEISANGMSILAHPRGNDDKIISGESGAVSAGLTFELMTDENYSAIRDKLGLNENSVVLCFSTEGCI